MISSLESAFTKYALKKQTVQTKTSYIFILFVRQQLTNEPYS